jgi:hypothetical protein
MFDRISEAELMDAAFFVGISPAYVTKEFIPLPVTVDGLATVAFCVRAHPVTDPDRTILHPVMIIPHRGLIVQDLRVGKSKSPISRVQVLPTTVRQGKLYRAAMEDPDAFFNAHWGK